MYEYLSREGAQVEVYRNDQITIPQIESLDIDRILISPGPGHPKRDAGISNEVIQHFKGKIPIFGVCLGLQCMFHVFGGEVGSAGEIVHGKTSTITHDTKGLFAGLPQDLAVTRYHSLAAIKTSVPEDIEITGQTADGVIMGIRHKKYVIEGVQFHPESILTEQGRTMVRNMLTVQGGTWEQAKMVSVAGSQKSNSILDTILAKSRQDLEVLKKVPGKTFKDLNESYAMGLAPPLIDFVDRLKQQQMSLLAEIKRASPSKGPIGLHIHVPKQALTYAKAGASAISVLTEPHWFKGSIDDLKDVRRLIDSIPNRPAVLRKEFIFDEYQILEARLAGADAVLLIVKMLDDEVLSRLYKYSVKLGMEPLVEVSSASEMTRAIALGAKVIGVNNRDLHSFNVDLKTTSNLVSAVPKGTILVALSGISSRAEVETYAKDGVDAILVGEALMRAKDTEKFISELISV